MVEVIRGCGTSEVTSYFCEPNGYWHNIEIQQCKQTCKDGILSPKEKNAKYIMFRWMQYVYTKLRSANDDQLVFVFAPSCTLNLQTTLSHGK